MNSVNKKIKYFFKNYIINLILFNIFSLIFLYDTTSFDQGLVSVQSFVYSINKLLLVVFIFIETIASYLDVYGVTFKILKISSLKFEGLNYKYIFSLVLNNSNYFIFFVTLTTVIFLRNKINFPKESKQFKFLIILIMIISITLLFKNLSNIQNYYSSFKNRLENNFILRNDNWYLISKFNQIYSNDKENINNFEIFNIEKLILNKKNIYVIINESYPNFKDKNLYENLLNKIIQGTDVSYSIYKRNYSKDYTTLASEEFVLCNKFDDSFVKLDLNDYLIKNNCWSKNIKQKKIFIHSYKKDFANRYDRYQSFFNKMFFNEDLKLKGIKECPWNDVGSCDYDIIDNFINIIGDDSQNKFVLFLTLNNHLGLINKTYEKEFLKCKLDNTLKINSDFCILYNNQIKFNFSVNKFLKQMSKDDVLIMLSDTPPMFTKKLKKYFNEKTDIFIFEK